MPLTFMKHHSENEIVMIEKNLDVFGNSPYENVPQQIQNHKAFQGATPISTQKEYKSATPIIKQDVVIQNLNSPNPFLDEKKKSKLNIVII